MLGKSKQDMNKKTESDREHLVYVRYTYMCMSMFRHKTSIYTYMHIYIYILYIYLFFYIYIYIYIYIYTVHVYAGRPNTERVGVHIFAATHPATLCSGGVGWGWVGGY